MGGNGSLWVIGATPEPGGYGIYRRTGTSGNLWSKVAGGAVAIAVTSDGRAWVINNNNDLFEWVSDTIGWQYYPGMKATDIGVGADDSVWVIGTDGQIYRKVANDGYVAVQSVQNDQVNGLVDGYPVGSSDGGRVHGFNPNGENKPFVRVGGAATRISGGGCPVRAISTDPCHNILVGIVNADGVIMLGETIGP